jgi:hypothetical protein
VIFSLSCLPLLSLSPTPVLASRRRTEPTSRHTSGLKDLGVWSVDTFSLISSLFFSDSLTRFTPRYSSVPSYAASKLSRNPTRFSKATLEHLKRRHNSSFPPLDDRDQRNPTQIHPLIPLNDTMLITWPLLTYSFRSLNYLLGLTVGVQSLAFPEQFRRAPHTNVVNARRTGQSASFGRCETSSLSSRSSPELNIKIVR